MPSEPQQHGTMSRDRTVQRLGRVAILSVLCSSLLLAPTAGGEQAPPDIEHPSPVHCETWWREQAAKHIEQIADDQARGRAIHNFTWVRVRAGDLEGARAAAREASRLGVALDPELLASVGVDPERSAGKE